MSDFRVSEGMARELPLSDAQKARVDELIPVKRFAKGDVLLREGEVARRCWFTACRSTCWPATWACNPNR